MGVAYRNQCYANALAVNQEICQEGVKLAPSANGCYWYAHQCTAVSATSISWTRSSPAYVAATGCPAQAATLTTTAYPSAPTVPACNELEKYQDLTTLWGLGLAGLVVLWALRSFILRQVAPH